MKDIIYFRNTDYDWAILKNYNTYLCAEGEKDNFVVRSEEVKNLLKILQRITRSIYHIVYKRGVVQSWRKRSFYFLELNEIKDGSIHRVRKVIHPFPPPTPKKQLNPPIFLHVVISRFGVPL